MTKDERFLLQVYKEVSGDIEKCVDPRQVAKELGFKEHLMKNILKGLMQANLVKRSSPEEVYLTHRGLEVAENLSR